MRGYWSRFRSVYKPLAGKEKRVGREGKFPCADREWCGAGVMPEDQGMLDTLGNAFRLARRVIRTIRSLSPDRDSVLHAREYR